MNEIAVGILGALVIVGGMVASLELRGTESTGADDSDSSAAARGPPPLLGESTWRVACVGPVLGWTPPVSSLADEVAPWTPRADGSGNGLVFVLSYTCEEAVVDGLAAPDDEGAFLLVAIDQPASEHNLTGDAFFALVGAIGWSATLAGPLDEQGFTRQDGSVALSTTTLPIGARSTTLTLSTDEGTLEATVTLPVPTTSSFSRTVTALAPREDQLAVFQAEERGQWQGNGRAVVSSSGTTWVSELGLGQVPPIVGYHTPISFDARLLERGPA